MHHRTGGGAGSAAPRRPAGPRCVPRGRGRRSTGPKSPTGRDSIRDMFTPLEPRISSASSRAPERLCGSWITTVVLSEPVRAGIRPSRVTSTEAGDRAGIVLDPVGEDGEASAPPPAVSRPRHGPRLRPRSCSRGRGPQRRSREQRRCSRRARCCAASPAPAPGRAGGRRRWSAARARSARGRRARR